MCKHFSIKAIAKKIKKSPEMSFEHAEPPWYDNMYTVKVIANFRGLMKNKHWRARVSLEKIRYIYYTRVYTIIIICTSKGKTELPYVVLILIFALNIVKP